MSRPLPPEVLRLARLHRLRQQTLAAILLNQMRRLWRTLSSDPQDSWQRIGPVAVAAMTAAQAEAARGADDYVAAALLAQGAIPAPAGPVPASAFAGHASDGRDLAGLLGYPAFRAAAFVAQGMDLAGALAIGGRHLDRIVLTEVADAARAATGVAIVNDRKSHGWIRMVSPPSCSRCVILAGKFYRYNAGFQRHPHCFPAGVVVSGPANLAATRRGYQGELVVIRTAAGQELPATGNHPVLTDRGWLPANLIQEGDHVVRSTRGQGAAALTVPDEDQMPARIEDCWRSDGMVPLLHVPTTAEDFHGDGGHGDVDVVLADRLLWDGLESSAGELAEEEEFTGRVAEALGLTGSGSAEQMLHRLLGSAYGVVRGGGLCEPLRGSHSPSAHAAGLGHIADLDPGAFQSEPDHVAGHPVSPAQAVLALPGEVGRRDLVDRQGQFASRWDAPAPALTVESRAAYASRGQDLLLRLAGQVELDRVVEVRRVDWSGHVYNLTSSEGWYCANGLIVSNCDCVHTPSAEVIEPQSPKALFDAMSHDELRRAGWSESDIRAIGEGADIYQVTNARRDLRSMSVAGRQVQATLQGATRRGLAGKRLGAPKTGRAVRLTPDQIYVEADRLGWSRDEIIRQLKRFGYIL